MAEQLAQLQINAPVSPDDRLLHKFDTQLDQLRRKCKDSRTYLST